MYTNLYQVYDKVSEALIGPIIVERNHAAATRAFNEALAGKGTIFNEHPEDFELWYLGEANNENGEITDNDARRSITDGAAWLKSRET